MATVKLKNGFELEGTLRKNFAHDAIRVTGNGKILVAADLPHTGTCKFVLELEPTTENMDAVGAAFSVLISRLADLKPPAEPQTPESLSNVEMM